MSDNGTLAVYVRLDGSTLTVPILILNLFKVIMGIIVVILNSIAAATILQKQKWRDLSCVFLMNLAASDTLMGIAVIYSATYNLLHFQFFHECVFRYSCMNAVIFSSVFMVLGFGFDRYLKIIFPFRYIRICKISTVVLYVAIVWASAVLLVVLPFSLHFATEHDDSSCGYFTVLNSTFIQIYACFMFSALTIKLFINSHILLVASSKICPSKCQNKQKAIKKIWHLRWTWWKPAKTVITIVGVNIVCIVPAGIFLLIATSGAIDEIYDTSDKDDLITYIAAPIILNSLANPLLYAYKIKDIRKTYQRIFCCHDPTSLLDVNSGHETLGTFLRSRFSSFRSSRRRSTPAVTPFPVSHVESPV